ncbi:MAG: hypothetical protein ABIO70_19395 [Pseudomonadota bacterium]
MSTPQSRADAQRKYRLLSKERRAQVDEYLRIFRENGLTEHYEVNEIISAAGRWDDFPDMRSRNRHANGAEVLGVLPFYFWMICELLEIADAQGSPLEDAVPY